MAWRWRTELTLLAALAAALWRLATLITITWAAIALAALTAALFTVPATRRFISRRFWCVLGRHRIQRLCYEARLHTRSGRIPLVLWTRPTKVGERAHILCRAGVCAEDFEAHIGELRAACYARDARVTRNTRWSQLVTIDIIRRDTLAASHAVGSPLRRLTAHYQPDQAHARPARRGRRPPSHPSPPLAGTAVPGPPSGGCPPLPRLGREATCHDHHHITAAVPVFPLSIFGPVHLGIDENGDQVHVDLAERNMLLGGEPGGGKSNALNLIVAHGALSGDCS